MMLDPEDREPFPASGTSSAGESANPSQRHSPPRVLLIEDEAAIRVALRRFFGRMGWDVAEAPDGRQALDLLLGSAHQQAQQPAEALPRYDMVLSDVRMPGLNGIQLHERLKSERPDIIPHLVFSTGDIAGTETLEFVRDIGCPVIQKPFQLSLLKELADRLSREAP